MKRIFLLATVILAAYLCCGFYIVKGNEKVLVRRFGKARLPLVGSGLHYDLPWPLGTISRINPNEIRTIEIGAATTESVEGDQFLLAAEQYQVGEFLTGDKNILNLQVHVQYRISEEGAVDYLFGCKQPERHLRLMAESLTADVVARSGVDYVHPLGLAEMRAILTRKLRDRVAAQRLGIHVENVTIAGVYPPVLVKQAFLDVSDARASKEKFINEALAYREQTIAAAGADAQQQRDLAESSRRTAIESARGEADRFEKIVAQFRADEADGVQSYAQSRQMALRQKYLQTLEVIIPKLAGKIFLDAKKPVDLTIVPDPDK